MILLLRLHASARVTGLGPAPFQFHKMSLDARGPGRVLAPFQFPRRPALPGLPFSKAS